jgi:hypothetical protein
MAVQGCPGPPVERGERHLGGRGRRGRRRREAQALPWREGRDTSAAEGEKGTAAQGGPGPPVERGEAPWRPRETSKSRVIDNSKEEDTEKDTTGRILQ